ACWAVYDWRSLFLGPSPFVLRAAWSLISQRIGIKPAFQIIPRPMDHHMGQPN
ncbi:unnamed protein product, partial [Ilex paraguariensis]